MQDLPKLPRLPKRAYAGGHRAPLPAQLPPLLGALGWPWGSRISTSKANTPRYPTLPVAGALQPPPKKLQSLPFPTREGNSLHLRQRSSGVCRRGAVQRRYLQCLGAGSRLIFITRERSIWNMNNANCACIDLA